MAILFRQKVILLKMGGELLNSFKKIRRKTSYERKNELAGLMFVLPWLIGFVFFFAKPFVQAIIFSFNKISFPDGGGISYRFIGAANYMKAFTEDPQFVRDLTESLVSMASRVVIILFFSLFIAMLLNGKFRGRTFFRAVYFLPVIIASGVIIDMLNSNEMAKMLLSGDRNSILFQASGLQKILMSSGFDNSIVTMILNLVNNIFSLSWKSGIQILLFLAGLQTVPKQLYEAASVEGATKWEEFWRVTFPMIIPMILLNIIYTIIDEFTDYTNSVMKLILTYAQSLNIDYSSALALIYFIIIFIVIIIVYFVINRRIST